MRRVEDRNAGVSAVSVGRGWSKFVQDQDLRVGAFLTFELVDSRCLVVSIHRRSGAPATPPSQVAPLHISGSSRPAQGVPQSLEPATEVIESSDSANYDPPSTYRAQKLKSADVQKAEVPKVDDSQRVQPIRGRAALFDHVNRPHFRKTLRKTHLTNVKSSRLVSYLPSCSYPKDPLLYCELL